MATQSDIRQEFTNQIIDSLKKGTVPWRKPWNNDPNAGLPSNVISKKRYQGINVLLLSMVQQYESKYWATFKQWQSLGGSVKRGEMGTRIVFYKPIKRQQKNADGKFEEVTIPIMKTYILFNAAQTTLDEFKIQDNHVHKESSHDYTEVETVVTNSEAEIRHGGNVACYYREGDYIQMPFKNQFPNVNEYHETLLHEFCHWSESRLNWTSSYEMNELVAEIGSCFLSRELGIPQSEDFVENHSAYVASWLRSMQGDTSFIFKASTQASKVADFMLAFREAKELVHKTEEILF